MATFFIFRLKRKTVSFLAQKIMLRFIELNDKQPKMSKLEIFFFISLVFTTALSSSYFKIWMDLTIGNEIFPYLSNLLFLSFWLLWVFRRMNYILTLSWKSWKNCLTLSDYILFISIYLNIGKLIAQNLFVIGLIVSFSGEINVLFVFAFFYLGVQNLGYKDTLDLGFKEAEIARKDVDLAYKEAHLYSLRKELLQKEAEIVALKQKLQEFETKAFVEKSVSD